MSAFQKRVNEILTVLTLDPDLHYFSYVLLGCKIEVDNSIPTAATNGIKLKFNEDWFMGLEGDNEKEKFNHQAFVILHEGMHPAFMDLASAEGKDLKLWNYACDYVNNAFIKNKVKKIRYPMNCGYLYNPKYENLTKEEVYELLINDSNSSNIRNTLDGDLQNGESEDNSESDNQEVSDLTKSIEQVKNVVSTASTQVTTLGKPASIPDQIRKLLDEIYHPKMDWYSILIDEVLLATKRDDFSFNKPSLVSMDSDLIFPSLYSEAVGKISVARDSSLSMTDSQLAKIHGALVDIKNTVEPNEMEIITFTTRIHDVEVFGKGEPLENMDKRVRGGTLIEPVFNYLEDRGTELLLVFSDMLFSIPSEQPPYPVIWINTGQFQHDTVVPYGRHIICK